MLAWRTVLQVNTVYWLSLNELDNIPDIAVPATTFSGPPITIVKNTGHPVTTLYISPTASATWGYNRLTSGQTLGNGQSIPLQLPFPINQTSQYDIRLVDTDDRNYDKRVQVTANGRIVFTMDEYVEQREQ